LRIHLTWLSGNRQQSEFSDSDRPASALYPLARIEDKIPTRPATGSNNADIIFCRSNLFVRCVGADAASFLFWADEPRSHVNEPYIEHVPGSAVTFEMVSIPAGKFLMGSPAAEKDRKPDEGPQFEVTVDAFYMQSMW